MNKRPACRCDDLKDGACDLAAGKCPLARPGPWSEDQCRVCWLALNDAAAGTTWGVPEALRALVAQMPPNVTVIQNGRHVAGPPPPMPRPESEWPWRVRMIAARKAPEDKGVGDTIARRLGKGGEKFKEWYKFLTGHDCGCAARQERLNLIYPYQRGEK